MAKRAEIYLALHDKGLTYEEIGKIYGVSRQAVWSAVNKHSGIPQLSPHSEATIRKVKYGGLMKWMLDNHVSMSELERRCDSTKLRDSLCGKFEPRKKYIDTILAVTGLTYEECFKEREDIENQ